MELTVIIERMETYRHNLAENGGLFERLDRAGRVRWLLKFRIKTPAGWRHKALNIGRNRTALQAARRLLELYRLEGMERDPDRWHPHRDKLGVIFRRDRAFVARTHPDPQQSAPPTAPKPCLDPLRNHPDPWSIPQPIRPIKSLMDQLLKVPRDTNSGSGIQEPRTLCVE